MENTLQIGETWMHYKTKGEYEIINLAKLQVKVEDLDMAECVVYKSKTDELVWVRPLADFIEDLGEATRFVKIN